MSKRFTVEAVFKAVDGVTAPISKMQNRVGMFTRSMSRGFHNLNRVVGKFSAGIKKGVFTSIAALTTMGVALFSLIKTGADFEQTLVSAVAKFPGEIKKGTAEYKALNDAARQVGRTTEFTAAEGASAINFLAMAGFTAKQAISALPGVIDLATAANIDLATATDVATDSLGAFGLMTKDAKQLGLNLARVNDVIAKTTTTSNTTVELMFESIKEGGPVATAAGASIETFSTLVGELANAGIKGARAGTTLKNVFLRLQAPSGAGAKALKKFGIVTADANGDMLDVVKILGNIGTSLDHLGSNERAGVLDDIFGKIPIAGVNVLLKSGSERLNDYRKKIENSSGAAKEMAAVMRNTLQGRLNSLGSAIESVKLTLFALNEGPLNDVVEEMTEWVRVNEKLIAENIGGFIKKAFENLPEIIDWVKQIGIGLAVFFTFSTVLKTLTAVMTTFNLVMSLNPIFLMIAGVAILAGLIAGLVVFIDDVNASMEKMPFWIRLILSPLEGLVKAIKAFKDAGAFFGGKIGSFLFDLINPESESDTQPNGKNNSQSQMVTPSDRIAKSISEETTTNKQEVTIKSDSGTPELTAGILGPNLKLQSTGGP